MTERKMLTDYPHLVAEWDDEKNSDVDIEQVSHGLNKKVWWKCSLGHSWIARIADRTSGKHNCPYCANRKVLKGFNDLATTHSYLLKEWDFDKNLISPGEVVSGSEKKVWWICDKNHSFEGRIKSRIYYSLGCPICSNRVIVSGVNDVVTTHPKILNMIDFSKSSLSDLSKVSAGSKKEFWWLCQKGHSSIAALKTRLLMSHGCPSCYGMRSAMEEMFTSLVSKVVFSFNPQEEILNNSRKVIPPYELDVYVPGLSIAFEFNGKYWHSDEHLLKTRGITAAQYHQQKIDLCVEKAIDLHFVKEVDWLQDRAGVEKFIYSIVEQKVSAL